MLDLILIRKLINEFDTYLKAWIIFLCCFAVENAEHNRQI